MTQIYLPLHCSNWFCLTQSQKEKIITNLKQEVMNERPNSIIVRFEKVGCYA